MLLNAELTGILLSLFGDQTYHSMLMFDVMHHDNRRVLQKIVA